MSPTARSPTVSSSAPSDGKSRFWWSHRNRRNCKNWKYQYSPEKQRKRYRNALWSRSLSETVSCVKTSPWTYLVWICALTREDLTSIDKSATLPAVKKIGNIHPGTKHFKKPVEYYTYRSIQNIINYDWPVSKLYAKTTNVMITYMNLHIFNSFNAIFIAVFLKKVKLVCAANGFYKDAAMWTFYFFFNDAISKVINERPDFDRANKNIPYLQVLKQNISQSEHWSLNSYRRSMRPMSSQQKQKSRQHTLHSIQVLLCSSTPKDLDTNPLQCGEKNESMSLTKRLLTP